MVEQKIVILNFKMKKSAKNINSGNVFPFSVRVSEKYVENRKSYEKILKKFHKIFVFLPAMSGSGFFIPDKIYIN